MTKSLKSLVILFKAYQSVVDQAKESLRGSGVNLNEFGVLEALNTKHPLNTQELAARLLIPNSSLTYVLDCLEKKEYIERRKDEKDMRLIWIYLSDKGLGFIYNQYQKHAEYMAPIFEVLSDDEEQQLQRLLKKVGKKAQERRNRNDI